MDLKDTIEGVEKGYLGVTTVFDDIYNRVQRVRDKKLSMDNLLRAYYFEVVHNIELLSIVDFEKLKRESPNGQLMKAITSRIETQIGSTLLFCEKDDLPADMYKFLKKRGQLNSSGGEHFYENILQAISFTVVKSELMRRVSAFGSSEIEVLKVINIDRRVKNVLERFKMIKRKLEELPAITSVAR